MLRRLMCNRRPGLNSLQEWKPTRQAWTVGLILLLEDFTYKFRVALGYEMKMSLLSEKKISSVVNIRPTLVLGYSGGTGNDGGLECYLSAEKCQEGFLNTAAETTCKNVLLTPWILSICSGCLVDMHLHVSGFFLVLVRLSSMYDKSGLWWYALACIQHYMEFCNCENIW